MVSGSKAEQMLEAPSFEDCAKMLVDNGYEDMSQMNLKQIESRLSEYRAGMFRELESMLPDVAALDLFRLKYDYHNAKVILKAEAMESASDHLLSDAGRISPAELKSLYREEKFSSMPGHLGKAMEEASSLLARTANPQQADFVLDKAYYAEFTEAAKQSGNAFLQGYGKLLIDCANLKSTVRTMRMGKDRDFLKDALIPGGSIGTDRILAASDKEALAALFSCSELEKAAALGAEAIDG
jgi:V/A-type H+-transporting ATPase subunit C